MAREAYDIPPLSKALIDALDALFPECSAGLNDSYDLCMWKGGQRSVVRKLIDEYRRQSDNILTR
jgi:hypothetical protein